MNTSQSIKTFARFGCVYLASPLMAAELPMDSLFNDEFPVVLSATRLKQPRNESPASVTIIDAEMIRQTGYRSLAEVLRLVPGMTVGYERGHVPEVGYHTLGGENSRHLQVLVDGRSIYQAALARILWDDLPLALDKIARIEVIRGSNAAMYGANSYLAVINIITRFPEDRLGQHLEVTTGNHGILDSQYHIAKQFDSLAFDLTLGTHQDDGFERDNNLSNRFDGHKAMFFAADTIWRENDQNYIRLQFGASDSDKEVDGLDSGEPDPFHLSNVKNSFAHLVVQSMFADDLELRTQAFATETTISENWTSCGYALFFSQELYDLFELDATYTELLLAALGGGLPLPPIPNNDPQILAQTNAVVTRLIANGTDNVCGTANQDLVEKRFDLETQLTWTFSDDLRLVSGLSYRLDDVNSESYFAGSASKSIWRLFGHAEYRLSPKWLLNIGMMEEKDSLIGTEASPRFALSWLPSNQQSFRLIYSTANRSPDLFEEKNVRSYTLRNLTQPVNGSDDFATYYQHVRSNGGLDFENIESWELGWYFRSDDQTIESDVKLFDDRLSGLLEGDTLINEFNLSNTGTINVRGVEAQVSWFATPSIRFWTTASIIDNSNASLAFYQRTTPSSVWSVNGFITFDTPWSLSVSYQYYDDWFLVDFKRLDMSARYTTDWDKLQMDISLNYQHRYDNNHLLDSRSAYNNPDKLYLTASLRW